MDLILPRRPIDYDYKDDQDRSLRVQGPSKKFGPSTSEIPDLFFDEILFKFQLNQVEILVLMYLYRQVWCRPNIYKIYGVNQVLIPQRISDKLGPPLAEIEAALYRLEGLGFIERIRPDHYFVRKYFTEQNDLLYGQSYDQF